MDLYSAKAVPYLPASQSATSLDDDARAQLAAQVDGNGLGDLEPQLAEHQAVDQLVLSHAGADSS